MDDPPTFVEDPHRPYAFLAMPFHRRMNKVAHAIRTTINDLGIPCYRIDDTHFNSEIAQSILKAMRFALFTVVEVSEPNPNVYYELGWAHAIGRPLIALRSTRKASPFDISHLQHVTYGSASEISPRLSERIRKSILINTGTYSEDSRRGKFGRSAIRSGRILTGVVKPSDDRPKTKCDVILQVRRISGKPLRGKVKFYMYPDYPRTTYTVQAIDDVASFEFDTFGSFTVGAVADNGKTPLEIDLRSLPGGNAKFYQW